MGNLSDYSFYVLDSKKIGLFPREKFIFKSLKLNNIKVKNIYSLVPFKFWSNKTLISYKYFFKYFVNSLIGKNYLNHLIKKCIFKKEFNKKEYKKITHLIHTALVDSTNKATNSLLTKGLKSFFISNIKWKIRYVFFAASICAIVEKLGNKILNLTNTCIVIGDIYYCHETLLSILLLFKNATNERNNRIFFYSGYIYNDLLFDLKNIDKLREPNGPYGSKNILKIRKDASLKDEKFIYSEKININFKNFVLYPPCVSDTYHFTEPNVYSSQYEWANDLFKIHSNKEIFLKMHPRAHGYNDINYWCKLFKSLGIKYKVKINYLDTNLKLDEVMNLGFYPLSAKGTVGLELIERGIPALFLDSNTWSSNFPRLKINNKKDYKNIIINSLKIQNINFNLKNFKPSKFEINLAKSILENEKSDFYTSVGIDSGNLPKVLPGRNNRIGKKNYIKDQEIEKLYLEKMLTEKSTTLLIKNLGEMLSVNIK